MENKSLTDETTAVIPSADSQTQRPTDSLLEQLEGEIRKEIRGLSPQELERKYREITVGSCSYIGSFRGVANIRKSQENDPQLTYRAAYANALATYRFAKKMILAGNSKKLRIKRDSRHSEFVDPKQVFEDAARRIVICEEYDSAVSKSPVRIFPVEGHSMTDIADAMHAVEKYRKQAGVRAIAFEPHQLVEPYLREIIEKGNFEDMESERAGYDTILVSYAKFKGLPIFCLSRHNGYSDLRRIQELLRESEPPGNLASVVEKDNIKLFGQRLSDYGFRLV